MFYLKFYFFSIKFQLLQGVALPAMTVLWIHWSPKLERSFFVSVCLTGCASGLIVALPVTALISSRLGWESVFYIFSKYKLKYFINMMMMYSNNLCINKSEYDEN